MKEIDLSNNLLTARISANPFELSSLVFNNQEYIYQKQDGWLKSWPICFPITGKLFNDTYWYNNKKYQMSNHGVFRDINKWKIIKECQDEVIISYSNINDFSEVYPFAFTLEVRYLLSNNTLINEVKIINNSQTALPYYFGWHPAFLLDHKTGQVNFDSAQTFSVVPIDSYLQEKMPQFTKQQIKLSDLDFTHGRSFTALNQTSKQVEIKDDKRTLILITKDYENVVVWKNDNLSNFICVEPWMGHQDYYNEQHKDILAKPWTKFLAPNEEKTYQLALKLIK